MTQSPAVLRAAIRQHLAKAPPTTAAQLAFDLNVDLGQTKSILKMLIADDEVTQWRVGDAPAVFTLAHPGMRQIETAEPSFSLERRSRPRMSSANFEKGFGRSHDVIVERRNSRTKSQQSTGTPHARDVLCPDEIARGRS